MDMLQGASNAAASNISGPVDALAWALRKAGVPVPLDPVLGAKWMADRGLTADPQNKIAGMVGETAGMVAPFAAAAKAPQIAGALLKGGENLAQPAMQGMAQGERGAIVYHGSPHKFDAFDASKIGTGEGAQAYGHGLYLAEGEDVAKTYAGMSKRHAVEPDSAHVFAAQDFVNNGMDPAAGLRAAYKQITPQQIEAAVVEAKGGFAPNLYKVDLPDNKIAQMLDWDKPLSQQAPGVQDAFPSQISGAKELSAKIREINKAANAAETAEQGLALSREANKLRTRLVGLGQADTMTGRELYAKITDALGGTSGDLSVIGMPGFSQYNHAGAAQRLRELGIPGVRYLDGGSRGAGGGTSNFVVFPGEENALQILERNGRRLR